MATQIPKELDRIVDKVLKYNPPDKTQPKPEIKPDSTLQKSSQTEKKQ
jgi:hypothetical protein